MPGSTHNRPFRFLLLPCFWVAGLAFFVAPLTGAGNGDEKDLPPAQEEADSAHDSIFAKPRLQPEYRQLQFLITRAFRAGEYEKGRDAILRALELSPDDPGDLYNLACAQALLGETEPALGSLEKSVTLGFRNEKHILEDKDLAPLHPVARFWANAARAKALTDSRAPVPGRVESTTEPSPVADGVALVTEKNTAWDFRLGVFRSYFDFPESSATDQIVTGNGIPRLLLKWWGLRGTAAGNHGDLYDNRDNDHSDLAWAEFPQLSRVEHCSEAKQLGLTMGLQLRHFFNAVTIGNSSTALTQGVYWRSQPRVAYSTPGGAALLHLQYVNNHLYLYPEHNDHDPGHNGEPEGGHGDVYPANTPYLLISQGSSGSDQPFLEAITCTLAAFRPEVKKKLRETGALMPAIQMIFRQSNKNLLTPVSYLTGAAHPTVFDARNLNVEKMVRMAHSMKANKLPPLIRLRVIEEENSPLGAERLFDTPQAIARIFRSIGYQRRMVVSAEGSSDPQGRKLKYRWVVLRGDDKAIRIKPLNQEGSVVELLIPWHPRRPILKGSPMESNRVDIGAFVDNGHYLSAPAFICTTFLDNEKREYDAKERLRVLDHTDQSVRANYVDPIIEPEKNWRDEFQYDSGGTLLGWTRIPEKGSGENGETDPEPMEFTADGKLVAKRNDEGEIVEVREVRYVVHQDEKGLERPKVVTAISNETFPYPPPEPATESSENAGPLKNESAMPTSEFAPTRADAN